MGLVLDEKCDFSDLNVHIDGEHIGEITSHAYSPKYAVHLAFVNCSLPALASRLTLDTNTKAGTKTGQLTKLPFNFDELGLTPKPRS
jgi:glycine cleavage system aminomethyltransferase T